MSEKKPKPKKINKRDATAHARKMFESLAPKEPSSMCATGNLVVIALHGSQESLMIRNDDLWRVLGMCHIALGLHPSQQAT